ncbi:MAG TPA: extracellular solute-binding protein, partial [Friedmanniella sp.]
MRRSIPVVAATLGLALTLAACSSDGDEPAAEDTSAAPAAGSAGTLTVWVDDTRSGPVKAVAEVFEQETGVTVKFVQKDFGKIRDDFISQVPAGQGPDIIVGAHDWLGKLVHNGVVAPIELGDRTDEFL